ncbi:MAG: ferrochelatase [Desulfobulbaceae bacterium]|nr:ferrochelatase [Desulfobulbaceae bacterium]
MTTLGKETIAVVLLNLGGPERVEDVRPFLYNLFSDRLIIRLGPAFLQRPIAWMIAKRRAPKSQGYYRAIGGGSPLNAITADQCRALETSLADHAPFRVGMVMRYWHPFAGEVLPALLANGVSKVVALTLYPHYSVATTGSSIRDLREYLAAQPKAVEVLEIDSWPDEPAYVDCLAERIMEALRGGGDSSCSGAEKIVSPSLPDQNQRGVNRVQPSAVGGRGGALEADGRVEVVYSAHSLPVKFVEEGDPYVDHLKRTIAALEAKTGKQGHLCFQSRSGPVEWLAPSTPETIEKLAAEGCRRIVMVPISFVSDHVETLCEIDMQYRDLAAGLGVELIRTRSLNTDPAFIAGLKGLVLSACQGKGWL